MLTFAESAIWTGDEGKFNLAPEAGVPVVDGVAALPTEDPEIKT